MKDSARIVVKCARVAMRPPEHRTRAGIARRVAAVAVAAPPETAHVPYVGDVSCLQHVEAVAKDGLVFRQPGADR
jgi:hypothetical protein